VSEIIVTYDANPIVGSTFLDDSFHRDG